MFKKSRVRGSFDKWHGEQSETLLKSERRHLYHIYWSLGGQLSWKRSLLMICKIIGLFVNCRLLTLYWLLMRSILFLKEEICCHIFRCIYLRNEKDFPNFLLIFRNLDWILKIFKEKDILLTHVFLKLRTPENVLC